MASPIILASKAGVTLALRANIGGTMDDLIKGIARLHPTNIRRKDVAPHHIPQPQEVPSMQDILDAAEASVRGNDPVVDHYLYLRDVDVENSDLAGQLRHRATLMRQRADQFDKMADTYVEHHLRALELSVRSYDEIGIRIKRLLEEHRHVEPTRE